MKICNLRTSINKGAHWCPNKGVIARGSNGQQVNPLEYNEDRSKENTRGPDSRAGARGTSGGVLKVSNAPKNIKYERKGNRQVFLTKCASYAEVWEPVEKLHKRFSFKALPETARVSLTMLGKDLRSPLRSGLIRCCP